MTRFGRAFVWVGGALFVGSLAWWAWWYAIPLSRTGPWMGWRPVAYDAALFTVFAGHHSLFARDAVKRRLSAIPALLRRSLYVWVASLLLILVCLLWQAVGAEAYTIHGAGSIALAGVQLVGLWIIARAVAKIDPLELAGIRAAGPAEAASTTAPRPSGLQITGPYRWVRHPVYLGWILIVFGAAHMTGDRLVFAIVSSLYLMVAVPWEERSLVQSFGDEYVRYQRRVRWRVVPYVY